jgi:hypothetical protein
MNTTYWRGSAEDAAMQDEHGFVWKAMLETIDVDLAGKRVLDAGCNRGDYYYDQKLLLRFSRASESQPSP